MKTFDGSNDFVNYMEDHLGRPLNDWTSEDAAFVAGALVIVDLVDEYPEWVDTIRVKIKFLL